MLKYIQGVTFSVLGDPVARRAVQVLLFVGLLAASLMLTGTAFADGPSPGPVGG